MIYWNSIREARSRNMKGSAVKSNFFLGGGGVEGGREGEREDTERETERMAFVCHVGISTSFHHWYKEKKLLT